MKLTDHFAVWLEWQVPLTVNLEAKPHKARIDLKSLARPDAAPFVDQLCRSLPEIPWTRDAHTHYDTVAEHLVNGLTEAFPLKRAKRRRCFISDATWGYACVVFHFRRL